MKKNEKKNLTYEKRKNMCLGYSGPLFVAVELYDGGGIVSKLVNSI